jgi:hypothetical protein
MTHSDSLGVELDLDLEKGSCGWRVETEIKNCYIQSSGDRSGLDKKLSWY